MRKMRLSMLAGLWENDDEFCFPRYGGGVF